MAIYKQVKEGLSIQVCSYPLADSKRWRFNVVLFEDNKFGVRPIPLLLLNREFTTEEEADNYALTQAKMWIERNM